MIQRHLHFGRCEKCNSENGHDYALGGVFCPNPNCPSRKARPVTDKPEHLTSEAVTDAEVLRARVLAYASDFSPDDIGGNIGTCSYRNPDGPELYAIIARLVTASRPVDAEQGLALDPAFVASDQAREGGPDPAGFNRGDAK